MKTTIFASRKNSARNTVRRATGRKLSIETLESRSLLSASPVAEMPVDNTAHLTVVYQDTPAQEAVRILSSAGGIRIANTTVAGIVDVAVYEKVVQKFTIEADRDATVTEVQFVTSISTDARKILFRGLMELQNPDISASIHNGTLDYPTDSWGGYTTNLFVGENNFTQLTETSPGRGVEITNTALFETVFRVWAELDGDGDFSVKTVVTSVNARTALGEIPQENVRFVGEPIPAQISPKDFNYLWGEPKELAPNEPQFQPFTPEAIEAAKLLAARDSVMAVFGSSPKNDSEISPYAQPWLV